RVDPAVAVQAAEALELAHDLLPARLLGREDVVGSPRRLEPHLRRPPRRAAGRVGAALALELRHVTRHGARPGTGFVPTRRRAWSAGRDRDRRSSPAE